MNAYIIVLLILLWLFCSLFVAVVSFPVAPPVLLVLFGMSGVAGHELMYRLKKEN